MTRSICLLLLMVLMACRATAPIPNAVPPAQPWLDSGETFRLRHDGVLRLAEKTIPLIGFMVLDTEHKRARLALLTGFGIRLATLDVSAAGYTLLGSGQAADRIPHFIDECAFSVQRIFLIDKASSPDNGAAWSIRHEGRFAVGGYTLPEKTVFSRPDARYTISLQLNSAEIQ